VLVILLATAARSQCACYPKIEASFTIPNLATDPFDYTVTDVRVQIVQPDGSTNSLPAFFDGGNTWRVRHTPQLPGFYQVAGLTLNGQPLTPANLQPANWTVAGASISPGFVRVDPANTNRFITSNGRRYFPVGHDVAWDVSSTTNVVNIMARLGGAHENWSRVWMDHWDGKNLDWPKVGANFGTLNLTVAQKWDAIVAAADQAGVSFQMTLQHHGQYSTSTDSNWAQNPYNTTNGGFLSNAAQFFTNATAKALTKRKFRYAIARWGYSPAIMAWELFNEVQFSDAAQAGQWAAVGAWHDEMAQFLRSQDLYQHLITTSSNVSQPIWNQCDYYTHHDYPSDLISALQDPTPIPNGQPVKPIFGAESGSDPTFYFGISAPLWAGLMGAQSGAAEPWYWDRIDREAAYNLLRPLAEFVLRSGIPDQDSLNRSAPAVTCPQMSSLVFSPGGGWATAAQDTFTVGNSAPNGIGSLPSYLQGVYHRAMTPNGFTFLVNYPPGGGTFSVQIIIVAQSGAGLQITVDNITTNSVSFAPAPSDQNTNFTLSVDVPAGQHTFKLWNPGLDWVDLGNITLNPYTPIIGAYQVGNSNFAALWLWHRTNIYNPTAIAGVPGSVSLAGLQPGTYSATWWDTFTSSVVSNFNFTVGSSNAVQIATPPVLRSLALFAGAAPQATISPPLLNQTLGTNSPPLNLSLAISNSGGLPLAYSLSVTGASPVDYAASDPTQVGGPVFAWKDISPVGRDLTTNFTALIGKTAKDEGIAGPVNIGFGFPFFSGAQSPAVFSNLYVSPNGFVSFSPFSGDTSTNRSLPNSQAPTNLIAFFWDDLDLGTTGRVFAITDSIEGRFTLQFQNVLIKGTPGTVTCQLILKTSGEILMQYKSTGVSNACTVGLQNAAASQGLQVAFNQNYLQSSFALCIVPTPWLTLAANACLVSKNATETIGLALNPGGLAYGNYSATILIQTADAALPVLTLPVSLSISPIATWRQTFFGRADNAGIAADSADPDHDGLVNLLEYALGTDPTVANASPLSYALVSGHLNVSFKGPHPAPSDISYWFEIANDLLAGIWQSGSAFTIQSVTDNHDGSETVTVIDNTPPSSTPHYLRIRITRP
jgi:hypothetical protein